MRKIIALLAASLLCSGATAEDVEVAPLGETAALIARYRGDDSSGKAPILLLGHMDVVEALAKGRDSHLGSERSVYESG